MNDMDTWEGRMAERAKARALEAANRPLPGHQGPNHSWIYAWNLSARCSECDVYFPSPYGIPDDADPRDYEGITFAGTVMLDA